MKTSIQKRLFAAMLAVVTLVIAMPQLSANAFIPSHVPAVVTEVIDINAIRVQLQDGQTGLVRLIGIDSHGSQNAIRFLSSLIMGTEVVLTRDPLFPNVGRWNYMYVFSNGHMVNGQLILAGVATANPDHERAHYFSSLSLGENIALSVGLGVWASQLRPSVPTREIGRRVNINTASAAQLTELLGASPELASGIVQFRDFGVFQHVNDVKLVPGITRSFFDENRFRMVVSTNINTADIDELLTLEDITAAQANSIVNSRIASQFNQIGDLFARGILTAPQLNANHPFLDTETFDFVNFARPNNIANINTATHFQMTRAGIPPFLAGAIVSQRVHGVPYRNLFDLRGFDAGDENILTLFDNVRTHTNINTAPQSELESLFGVNSGLVDMQGLMASRPFSNTIQLLNFMPQHVYDPAANFMYITPPTFDLVNINTAGTAALVNAGFTIAQANALNQPNRPHILLPSQIPPFVSQDVRHRISLFTNINTASVAELMSLDSALTMGIANQITQYVNEQPFGSMAEIEAFFVSIHQAEMFARIQQFVIFR